MRKYAPNRIGKIRKSRDLTQQDLAESMESHPTIATVSKLELSQMALTVDYLLEISEVLQVSPLELILEDQDDLVRVPVLSTFEAIQQTTTVEGREFRSFAGGKKNKETVSVSATNREGQLIGLRPSPQESDQILTGKGILIIDIADQELVHGKKYAIIRNGDSIGYFRYQSDPAVLKSLSNHPASSDIIVGKEQFLVAGRIIQAITEF